MFRLIHVSFNHRVFAYGRRERRGHGRTDMLQTTSFGPWFRTAALLWNTLHFLLLFFIIITYISTHLILNTARDSVALFSMSAVGAATTET